MLWSRRSMLGSICGVAILLGGCSADNPALLRREVERLVRPGMSMAAAEQALGGADFSCEPDRRGRDCSRSRSQALIITCVQRVTLIPDPSGATLAAFDTPAKVACLGTP